MYEKVEKEFKNYVNNFDLNKEYIKLKYNHSFNVANLMAELSFRLNLDKEKIELAKVVGLLHDIGRFKQLELNNSFSDKLLDHAVVGCKYLFDEGHIRDFIDDNKFDKIINTAIKNHNKKEIESNLSDDELLFSKMIRDMDKIDIYYQESVHFNTVFNASEINDKLLEEFKNEHIIGKDLVKSKTDSTLLQLAFIFDINFNESFDILVDSDNFDLYLSTIDVDNDSEKLFKKVKELCFDKINRGVNNGNGK